MNYFRCCILFCVFIFGIAHLWPQNTSSDFYPIQLISDELNAPGRMAVDSNDHIYVIDAKANNIAKYDNQGSYLASIDTGFSPLSIAIDHKDQLYIGALKSGIIYKINAAGEASEFSQVVSKPSSMAFGSNHILYVIDSRNKQVVGLDTSGAMVSSFTNELFTYPIGLTFDPQNEHIIVSEHGGIGEDTYYCYSGSWSVSSWGPNTSIYIFTTAGELITSFGCFGTQDGRMQRIQGIRIGPCGNIYAVDPFLGRVSVFDANGNYITHFGEQGDTAGSFNLPMDIVFNSDNRAFVTSMNKDQIDVFSINQPLPTASIIGMDETICEGTSTAIPIKLTGTAPWTITYTVDGLNPTEITTNEAIYNLQVSLEGKYEITNLIDGNNLTGDCITGSKTIWFNSVSPTATFMTNEIIRCEDSSEAILIDFTGMAPWTFTYTIDGNQPTAITTTKSSYALNADREGLYEIVALYDAVGCQNAGIIGNTSVQIYQKPTANIIAEDFEFLVNKGDSVDVNIVFAGEAPYTFNYLKDEVQLIAITTSDNPYLFTVGEEGTYEIMSVADSNCSNNDWQGYFDIVIIEGELPSATIVSDHINICNGDSAVIDVAFTGEGPWTFTYTINGRNPIEILSPATSYQLIASDFGLYELSSVYDALNTQGTVSGSVIVGQLPDPLIELPESITLCEGDSVELNPGEFESYLWNDGSTSPTLVVYSAGAYSVSVIDENGCTASATVVVTTNELPYVDLGPEINLCEGDPSYILDAGDYESYSWSDGSTGRTLAVSATGIYSVTVTNASGCTASDWVNVVVNGIPDAYYYYDADGLEVQFVNSTFNADSYYWDFGDGHTSTDENPLHRFRSKGTYIVSLTAISDHCENSVYSEAIQVSSKTDDEAVHLYPNPSTGMFTVVVTPEDPIFGDISILVTSTSGQSIYFETFDPNTITSYNGSLYIDVNIEYFTKGIYIVYVNASNFAGHEKLILKD